MVWIWALSFAIALIFADKIYAAFKNTFALLKRVFTRRGHPYWYDPLVLSYPLPDFISLGKFSQTRAKFVLIETLFKLEGILGLIGIP
jgi:hypothetical protein